MGNVGIVGSQGPFPAPLATNSLRIIWDALEPTSRQLNLKIFRSENPYLYNLVFKEFDTGYREPAAVMASIDVSPSGKAIFDEIVLKGTLTDLDLVPERQKYVTDLLEGYFGLSRNVPGGGYSHLLDFWNQIRRLNSIFVTLGIRVVSRLGGDASSAPDNWTAESLQAMGLVLLNQHLRSDQGRRKYLSLDYAYELCYVYGRKTAIRMLLEAGGLSFLLHYSQENFGEFITQELPEVFSKPFAKLRSYRREYSKLATFRLARPKYRDDMMFLLGQEAADAAIKRGVMETVKMWKLRVQPSVPLPKQPKLRDLAPQLYKALNRDPVGIDRDSQIINMENEDILNASFGEKRARKLLLAHAQSVLSRIEAKLPQHTRPTFSDALSACFYYKANISQYHQLTGKDNKDGPLTFLFGLYGGPVLDKHGITQLNKMYPPLNEVHDRFLEAMAAELNSLK